MNVKASAYEAKTHLSQLLNRVIQGDTVTITRHGVPVATLGPPVEDSKLPAGEVIEQLRNARKGATLGDVVLKDAINQGRR